jgi:ABC-type uncharacterized transport system permease subunit
MATVGTGVRMVGMSNRTTRHRRRLVAAGIVVCPLISGVFFGLIAALLVIRNGDRGRAFEIGLLVGGAMFAANAIALCVLHSAARAGTTPKPSPRAEARNEARAS